MGIESDKLVFDYLSRVGDLAHGTSMSAAERARLVNDLRGDIDRMRTAEGGADSKAAVRKILNRLGKPEEVVAAAGGGAVLPDPRPSADDASGDGDRRRLPRLPQMRRQSAVGGEAGSTGGPESPQSSQAPASPQSPQSPEGQPPSHSQSPRSRRPLSGASPPHLAGMDELGPQESDPDWWRIDPGPYGGGTDKRPGSDLVPGFVGGIDLPEVLKPPAPQDGRSASERKPGTQADAGGVGSDGETADDAAGSASKEAPRPPLRRLVRRRQLGNGPAVGGFVELAAVALLVAGTVLGSLIPLGLGWLATYWSPRLSRVEAKWAALGMPGLVVGAGLVWFWGRTEGRWGGAPIPTKGDALEQAMSDAWPVALRVAAIASALFLLWRARRRVSTD